ncbi:hypothetical protein RSOLAG22IIIB_10208 [Rhizoctonia solani]|uniref:HAT C-terminal dimerisation domain-containing protein n=1 Tax=Rhizoctonia solani TaxID=456999 RepID=A0A0K6G294_9AGAM|nr:hypothetical protein RSOLAG22IIIB_10208 [Rhizoctonia solani]
MANENHPIDDKTESYLQALDSDPIEACRASIAACRSSGQRREALRKIIVDGNASGRFRLPNGDSYVVPAIELLRDTPTLSLAIVEFAFRNRDVQIPILSHQQYESLQDIASVLVVAHSAQELLLAEKTPTLSLAFPVYESVVQAWLDLGPKIPELATAIGAGIGKICEYVNRTKGARVHILAMVVNPAIKFDFIHWWWTAYDQGNAYEDVRETMMKFQREIYARTLTQTRAGTGMAAHAQSLGYLRVLNIGQTLRRASDNTDNLSDNRHEYPLYNTSTTNSAIPPSVHAYLRPTPAQIHAHNLSAVEFELNQYISQGTIPIEATGAIDLIEYWRAHKFTYPLLYRIAMDVLPVQASSVSSERVFSSSKMTCTAERNRLSVRMMEALQVLKHALKHHRRESSEVTLDLVSHVFETLELAD